MGQLSVTVSLTYRRKWLGIAFVLIARAPFALLGVKPSKATTKRIVEVASWMMGPKITVS